MLTKEKTIELIKDEYHFLSSEYGVARIGLFGSIAKGTETEDSDIDIIVELRKPIGYKFIELVSYLEKIFGNKVDILTIDGLKNIRIKNVAEDIKRNIIYV